MVSWYQSRKEEARADEPEAGKKPADKKPKEFHIKIDRVEYKVTQYELTGAQLRQLPKPPIGPDRDLFEVVPGKQDRKISDTDRR
ncbi:hypothetical protein BH09ACT10_BH09ACT10_20820 [soil metagenome]